MKSTWANDTARRIGLGGSIDFTVTRVGQTLHIPCAGRCRSRVDLTIAPGLSPAGVAKVMLNKGWTISRKPVCPGCSRKSKKTPVPPSKNEGTSNVASTPPNSITATQQPSEAARKAKRMVYLLLEEQYDETTNRYRAGWDDKRLAQESGASVNVVVQVREESFGPLGEPIEISEFKQDFARVKSDLDTMKATMEQTIKAIEQRFERICTKNGWVA